MPSITDTTPFNDPRNAVGLLTDVVDLVLVSSTFTSQFTEQELLSDALYVFIVGRDLSREFQKASRRVFNGHARKTSADLYQRLKTQREKIPAEASGYRYGDKRRDLYGTLGAIADRGLAIAVMVMEDFDSWKKYTTGWTQRQTYGGVTHHDAQWHQVWHDHVSMGIRLGADRDEIFKAECGWRFRDITDRSHRGRNMRAAFEAAWLAGEYKFARSLVE